MRRTILALWLLLVGGTLVRAQQTPHKVSLQPVLEMQYLLYLPEAYAAETDQEFPLLLFLHGGGESGNDLDMVKTHGPPSMIDQGTSFPFLVLTPQNPYPRKFCQLHPF